MRTLADVGVALVVVGAVLVVLCALALLRLSDACDRLHAVTPVTSLAGPVVLVGLALQDQTVHGIAKYFLAALVLAVTGPAVGTATLRTARARQEHGDTKDAPVASADGGAP